MATGPEIFLIILLVGGYVGIASDIYISSMPFMVLDLNTDIEKIQLSLTAYLIALSISQLFYGPLSEGIGRQAPLIIGSSLCFIGSIICYLAFNIEGLILGRFVQGLGAGAGAALWRSVFRDRYEAEELAIYGGYLSVAAPLMISISPAVGSLLQTSFGWRANFLFLTIHALLGLLCVSLLFKETSKHHHSERLRKKFIADAFRELLSSRVFMGYSVCSFLNSAASFSWFTASPVLFISILHLTPLEFGWITLVGNAGVMIVAGFTNAYMLRRFGSQRILRMGFALMFMGGSSMLLLKILFEINVLVLLIPTMLFFFGNSIAWANIFSEAFQPFGKKAGYAGSLYSFLLQAGGAASSAMISYLSHTDQVPLGLMITACSITSWLIYEFVINPEVSQNNNGEQYKK